MKMKLDLILNSETNIKTESETETETEMDTWIDSEIESRSTNFLENEKYMGGLLLKGFWQKVEVKSADPTSVFAIFATIRNVPKAPNIDTTSHSPTFILM